MLIRMFAAPLFRVAGLNANLVRITLLQDRAINAFVSTGNRMFLHTGLIQSISSAQELLGVMAHETGHVSGGHLSMISEQMQMAMLKSIAFMVLGAAAGVAARDSNAGVGVAMAGQAIAERGLYAFSRAQESAADQAGMTFLDRNGWSAAGMLRLFERLQEQELLASERQDPYLRTHPLTRERIETVRDHVAQTRYGPPPAEFESGLAMVKAKLDGFLDSPAATQRRYRADDPRPMARYALAIAYYRSGNTQPAVALMDSLLAEQRQNPWFHELKGQILFDGQRPREALESYRTATRIAPREPLLRMELARVMIELNDPTLLRPAIAELESSLSRERDNPFTWRQLGIAWGRLGEQGQSSLALAEEALLQGDDSLARLQAQRAENALPPGPAKLRAQDIRNSLRRSNRPR